MFCYSLCKNQWYIHEIISSMTCKRIYLSLSKEKDYQLII